MVTQTPVMNVMMRASEKAARTLLRDYNEVEHLQVSEKGPGDFVSAADRRAEEIIFEELKKARPDYSFLMEESGAVEGKNPDYRWIIDPLDGTTNFLHGLPHWAISIALEHKGEIIAGLIHDPVKDEIFHAEKGKGAFMRRRRLRVSGRNDMSNAIIATGGVHVGFSAAKKKRYMAEYMAIHNVSPCVRRFGAAALDLAYVAAGRYEGFWERDLKSWDVAAGIIIVKEAGGFISDLDDIRKNPVNTGNILATNNNLFDSIGKVLKSVK